MNTKELISDIITEAALDSRISDGIVNLENINHLQIVAEKLYDAVLSEDIVNEFVSNFVEEGKHPDRQAFNREGWLVTFPSKEYRDAAIKKGTHSIADPTHGKGGMNLYYKKKGKQKRQTQQAATAVATPSDAQVAKKPAAPVKPAQQKPVSTTPTSEPEEDVTSSVVGPEEVDDETPSAAPAAQVEKPTDSADVPEKEPSAAPDVADKPTPAEAPAIDVPVVETPPQQYANISKKFAMKKGWVAELYDEYRDIQGNTVAVIGLSGEVVPVKNTDREEYKLFAEKYLG